MADSKGDKGAKADKGAKPGKSVKPVAKGGKPDAAAPASAKDAKGKPQARKEGGPEVVAAGANALVAGSAVFRGGSQCYGPNIAAIRNAGAFARGEAA